MVNEKQHLFDSSNGQTGQSAALEGQLNNMVSGVERSLLVTCETIMDKMKQLEDKMNDMEKKYVELAKDAEKALKESGDTTITDGGGGGGGDKRQEGEGKGAGGDQNRNKQEQN